MVLNPFWHKMIKNESYLPARCKQNSIDATKCWQCHEYRDNEGKVAIHFCCKGLEIKYMKSSYLVETNVDSNNMRLDYGLGYTSLPQQRLRIQVLPVQIRWCKTPHSSKRRLLLQGCKILQLLLGDSYKTLVKNK